MNLRLLEYFLVVAREESITRAARLLHVTQPTLSRQMKQLETELGVDLFLRTSHNSLLTEQGILLRRRAEELIALAEHTKKELRREKEELIGEIAIGCGEFTSVCSLKIIMNDFLRKHPNVTLRIYSGDADTLIERMDRGLLDFCLVMDGINPDIYEFSVMPDQEAWGVYVPLQSSLAEHPYVTSTDIITKKIYLSGRTTVRERLATWLGTDYERLRIVGTGNLLYNMAMMLDEESLVIGIRLHCTYDGLRFIPLRPALSFSTLLAWKKQASYSLLINAVIEHIRSYKNCMS